MVTRYPYPIYLGGSTTDYTINGDGQVVEGSGYVSYYYDSENMLKKVVVDEKEGIDFYIGHDLGLFVKRRITSRSLVALLRVGVNNVLLMRPRFISDKSDASPDDKAKKEEKIKITHKWLTPNLYLGTGIQWYF